MSQWFASVDTAFLLNLEQGAKEEIEVFERLHLNGYKIRFVPVVSHELAAIRSQNDAHARITAGFLAKMHIYKIERLELDGNQLDYAKVGAEAILRAELIPSDVPNVAHFIAESACRDSCFIISGLSSVKAAKWKSVQNCLREAQINGQIKRFSVSGYLRKPALSSGYSKPVIPSS